MKSLKKLINYLFIVLFWFGVWELSALAVNQELYLPTPAAVMRCLLTLIITSEFWISLGASIFRVVLGILVSIILGVLIAVLTSRSKALHGLLYPMITIIKATPVASFIILAIIWLGASKLPVFICALMVFPIVWAAISDGIAAIDKKHEELAKVFGFSFGKRLRYIYVPTIAPYFLSACKTSIGLAWKAGVAAEVLAVSPTSIGKHLFNAKTYYEVPELFSWTITVIVLSLIIEFFVTKLLKAVERKYVHERDYADIK